ncbi:hypothetical protein C8Q78DRAFT_1061982 [Trametes maxima]|nr:hypothetical protein C8Q78DRAFT_1061982 [Trametes maxima]
MPEPVVYITIVESLHQPMCQVPHLSLMSHNTSEPQRSLTPSSGEIPIIDKVEGYVPDGCIKATASLDNTPNEFPTHVGSPTVSPETSTHKAQTKCTEILVPHIIVSWKGLPNTQAACGRRGVAQVGYHLFMKVMFDTFIFHPSRAPRRRFRPFQKSERRIFMETYRYLKQHFLAKARLVPQFLVQGRGSEDCGESETIFLQPMGWFEMISNVVSIRIDYELPNEFPGKANLPKLSRFQNGGGSTER